MDKKTEIKIIELSPKRWKEYKGLRTEAVSKSAVAFGNTEKEIVSSQNSKWQQKLKESLENSGNFWVFAEDNGKLVGMMGAYQGDIEKTEHNATIVGVYVNENYRGLGLSTKMYEVLFKKLKKNKKISRLDLEVTTTQNSAINLYKKLGFKETGILHKQLKYKGKYYDQLSMEKLLN